MQKMFFPSDSILKINMICGLNSFKITFRSIIKMYPKIKLNTFILLKKINANAQQYQNFLNITSVDLREM